MVFREYSEERRLQTLSEAHDGTRVDGLAYRYIDEIFSCDAAAYSSFGTLTFERNGEFSLQMIAHQALVTGDFGHIWIENRLGGRWTFWLRPMVAFGEPLSVAIFSIEFNLDGRLRYGTEGGWHERIERNPGEPWKTRDRLISNLLAAVVDHLPQARGE